MTNLDEFEVQFSRKIQVHSFDNFSLSLAKRYNSHITTVEDAIKDIQAIVDEAVQKRQLREALTIT